jgi:dienelactone hydrolase
MLSAAQCRQMAATLVSGKLRDIGTLFERQFRAAVAYYPLCEVSMGGVSVPTVILIGELDEITPAGQCREMMARRSGDGAALGLSGSPSRVQQCSAARHAGIRLRPP